MGGKSGGQEVSKLTVIQSVSGGYGDPVPIAYGTNRVPVTMGWYDGFTANENPSGGKGGGKGTSGSYSYTADILFFVCEGPINDFGKAWRDKDKFDPAVALLFNQRGTGTYTQMPWDFQLITYPGAALAYRGIALTRGHNFPLRDGAVIGNIMVEVFGRGITRQPGDQNENDAFIKDVIADFIRNPNYGAVDPNTYNFTFEFSGLHSYTQARNLLISPVLATVKPAHEYLKEWLTIANCACIFSEGKLKFLPYADLGYSNAFATYDPETTIQYDFDDDNMDTFLKPERLNPADSYNKVVVEFTGRQRNYNTVITDAKDEGAIRKDGLRQADKLTLDSVCLGNVAKIVAHTQLLRSMALRKTYTVSTNWDADLLEPLDFVTLTDPELGLNKTRCRIISIEDDEVSDQGVDASQPGGASIRIKVEEAPVGAYSG